MRPPSAESTPGVSGTTTSRMPSSRARKQAIIGPAPPKARQEKSRGSMPKRDTRALTSVYMPDTAMRMIASAVSSMLRPRGRARASTAARALSRSMVTAA